jgi:flagellar basal-body rod modification protein FlgD
MPDISAVNNQKAVNVSEMLEARKNRPSNVKIVRTANDTLDKNSFLKLLVTELSHQDPMQPVNDREFISQMAQFSSLEQMNNVAVSMNRLRSFQANTLVGKYVTGKDFLYGKSIAGNVTQVIYDAKGDVFLKVDGKSMKMDDVQTVEEKHLPPQEIVPRETKSPENKAESTVPPEKTKPVEIINDNNKNTQNKNSEEKR